MDRTPAADKVVIHIDRDDKHNGGTGSPMTRTIDDKHQNRVASPIARQHRTIVILSEMLNRARKDQASARDQSVANTQRRDETARGLNALVLESRALALRTRGVRRCAVVSASLGVVAMIAGMMVGGNLNNEPVIASSFAVGIVGPAPLFFYCGSMRAAEQGIANRRAMLERQQAALAPQEERTQRELDRADTDVKNCQETLTHTMHEFMVGQLIHYTPPATANIVADYVGINDDALQN